MARLMSVSYTEQSVIERRKTVTRRLGWTFLKPGDHLELCRKVMGRKPGEDLVRLVKVEVISATREPLAAIRDRPDDVAREGVEGIETADEFVAFFGDEFMVGETFEVTRIEWRYLE